MFQKLAEQIDGEGFLKAMPLLKTSHLKRSRRLRRRERGADCVSSLFRRSAPEQGTRPDAAIFSIKLRLLEKPTAPVSTALQFSTVC